MMQRFRVGQLFLLAIGALAILIVSPLPRFARVSAQTPQSKLALKTIVIPVEGMACVVCAASVKQAIKALDGVSAVEVDVGKKSARVTFAPEKITADRIAAAINNISGSFRAGTPKEVK